MIRTIDIRLNAAHPELPLPEATTYQNAPSTAFLRGVPKSCGLWQITAVSVAVTFPDNSTTTRAAVLSAGDVWVATIPACATSGRTTSGLRILADGTDENGDAVTGYVLGVADLAVATFDIAPAPGETSYALRYFDNVPNPPHKGDVATVDGTLKYYDGTAWQPFAGVPSPSTSAPLMDGTASAGTSAAYARGDHRHPTDTTRASKADTTLTERGPNHDGFSAWTIKRAGVDVTEQVRQPEYLGDIGEGIYSWEVYVIAGDEGQPRVDSSTDLADAVSLSWMSSGGMYTATRTALQGYQLGSQAGKPLASEAEAEALRTEVAAKYAKPSGGIPATDLAAAVQASLGKADTAAQPSALVPKADRSELCDAWAANTVYKVTSFVIHDNAIYRCTTAHTSGSSWDSTKWSATTIADVLALYLPKRGGTMTGDIEFGNSGMTLGEEFGLVRFRSVSSNVSIPSDRDGEVALMPDIPYSLGTQITIDSNSVQTDTTDPNNPITYAEVTLANRTANIVQVTAATALDELRITFPAATSGKVRDFGLRVEIGTGSAALAAPALVPIAPTGETIKIENADGTIPALADGTATAKGVTLLYFSETAPGVFVVKGEQVEEVA